MRRIKIGRVGIGIVVFVCAVALAAPAALAVRSSHSSAKQVPADANIANGYTIFNTYFCYACHSLKQGGPTAYGQLGVNLNKKAVPFATAQAVVINGLPAALPLYPTQMVGYKNVLFSRSGQGRGSVRVEVRRSTEEILRGMPGPNDLGRPVHEGSTRSPAEAGLLVASIHRVYRAE